MTDLISRTDLERQMREGTVLVVDALPPAYFDREHLPGAINLVEADVELRADELLPDKDAAIVTYCSNAACGNSQAVANRLERLGYTNVRKYREGIQDWVEAGLPVEAGSFAGAPASGNLPSLGAAEPFDAEFSADSDGSSATAAGCGSTNGSNAPET